MKFRFLLALLLGCLSWSLSAQQKADSSLVQFTGMVLDGSNADLYPIPYANVSIKRKGRGTFTDFKGFFSIVIQRTDTIIFSAIGYRSIEITVPTDLKDDRYSLVQLMSQDTINLPETIVFPWPSKDHFRLEFLAMNVDQQLQQRAVENLAQDVLERGRSLVSSDGNEHADYYLRQQSRDYYFIGQQPPMNIFNPIAWKQFFDAWKRGDYKKKKDK